MFTLKGIRKAMTRAISPRKTFAARKNPLELVKGNSPVKVNPVATFDARRNGRSGRGSSRKAD